MPEGESAGFEGIKEVDVEEVFVEEGEAFSIREGLLGDLEGLADSGEGAGEKAARQRFVGFDLFFEGFPCFGEGLFIGRGVVFPCFVLVVFFDFRGSRGQSLLGGLALFAGALGLGEDVFLAIFG